MTIYIPYIHKTHNPAMTVTPLFISLISCHLPCLMEGTQRVFDILGLSLVSPPNEIFNHVFQTAWITHARLLLHSSRYQVTMLFCFIDFFRPYFFSKRAFHNWIWTVQSVCSTWFGLNYNPSSFENASNTQMIGELACHFSFSNLCFTSRR